jgi:hypothetical protein
VSMQDSNMVCAERTIGVDWMRPKVLLGDKAQVEIVIILTQDTCTVCDERTIGSEIILDAPDGTSR